VKILGVDPGLLNLGCVLIEVKNGRLRLIRAETLRSPLKESLSKRLYHLYQTFGDFLRVEKPELLAIEEPLPKVNPHTTAKVSQVQAIVLLRAEEESLLTKSYNPAYWKKFLCGDGGASKGEVKKFLRALVGKEFDAKIKDDHTSDALALALVCAFELSLL
jgi:crossover junction endodeoxyribonuclease RuvC